MDAQTDFGAGSDAGDEQTRDQATIKDADALFSKLKRWCKTDYDSRGQTKWREEAREDFDFEAGEQLNEEDRSILMDANRPIVIFNRIGPVIDSVSGQEVANRQSVQYLPRKQGDVIVNEMLTNAADWFRDQCEAEDEESDAFRDTVVCGMGWTETGLNYQDNPRGDAKIDRVDPLEMCWDSGSKKRNLADMRRVFHIRRSVPLEEARDLCPGDPDNPFEDADYNATWIDDGGENEGKPHINNNRFYDKPDTNGEEDDDGLECVTLVRAQWWERVPVWMTLDPQNPGQIITLSDDEYQERAKKFKMLGMKAPKAVKSTRKVYRQAYLGNVLLEYGDAPIKGHFSFKCITGKRDRNKNVFFGLVRAMKDPARWSNKWLSQTMHIMNTSAKGGIAAERGQFFDNDNDGESSWAKNDQITWVKPGALGGTPKFIQKPNSELPQATFEMMNYAATALSQVSGVNVETLGMQMSGDQAAALDRQRKQSVMIILQPIFDALRRYRKEQGRALLYLIEHYLSDGRLIKIEGKDKAQYLPLIRQEADGDDCYDVIVDESPTSPNQKELTWGFLQQILPVIGKMLPPQTWIALLKYSPLPVSVQQDITDSIQQAQQGAQQQPDPEAQKAQAELQATNAKAQADIANHKAMSDAKIQSMREESATKLQIAHESAQHSAMLKALTAPPATGPDGQPVQGSGGGETAAAVLGLMQQLRQEQADMRQTLMALAQAQSAPKKLIRDPQTGDIVGIAPMGAQ